MEDIAKFIREVPKTELHLHIEGTLEPELMFDLAKRNDIKIPYSNVNEVKSAYNFSNLETFLNIYYEGSKVLINEKDFFDLTWSYAVKCREDNIVHAEIFFDPQAHLSRGVKFETIINGINNALLKANKEFGLTYKIIMCFLRHLDEKSAFKVLDQAIEHKDKIIAVGLDSSEKGNPPSKFKNVFKKAIKEGFLTVAHAGEEGPPEYIWEAINLLEVKRIDHGVQCLKDEKLTKELIKKQIPLTVCPLSNIKLCVFKILEEHNLRGSPVGVLVIAVKRGSPAIRLGFKPGDVFVQINSKTVKRVRDMERILRDEPQPWRIDIRRGKKKLRKNIG